MNDTTGILRDLVGRYHRAQEENFLYERAFDVTSAGFILTDAKGLITKMNPAAAELFGLSVTDLVGHETIFHLLEYALANDDERPDGQRIGRLLIKHGTVRKQRVLIKRQDGKEIPASLTINLIPMPNTEGGSPEIKTLGFVAVVEDTTELENLTVTDALTGLFNRRYFDRKLAEEYESMRRARGRDTRFLSLLFLDVDKFHDFNSAHGHQLGDLALQAVAQVMKEGVRYIDAACRYGGEEFAIILPATDHEGAVHSAQRLRERVAAVRFSGDGLSVTASIGISCHTHGDGGPEALVKDADAAMYMAKEQGRNRVVCKSAPKPVVAK